jgi:elongator complex protein 3
MGENNMKCDCLRCREVGHILEKNKDIKKQTPKLFIEKYNTWGGTEYFLSLEDKNRQAVFAFCRLRILDDFEKTKKEYKIFKPYPAYIRELHTYGQLLSFGIKDKQASQHKGMGQKLIKEAEKVVREHKADKLAIISGVGVRGYYRKKLGYRLENGYMVKKINI